MEKHNSVTVGILKRGKRTVVGALVVPGFGGDADQRVDRVLKVHFCNNIKYIDA